MSWRIGKKIKLNVYDSLGKPICQCHTAEDAALIVAAVNHWNATIQFSICPPVDLAPGLKRALAALKLAAVRHLDTLPRTMSDPPALANVSSKKKISLPRKAVRKK